MAGLMNVTFDDRDTDRLRYQGFWFNQGSFNASSVGQTGTLSSSSDLNANVTFTFPTPAVAFYYYGIPRCCGGRYEICIDCDPNNRQFQVIDAVNRTDDGHNPPVVLFSMTFSTPGIHEIIIRNSNDTRFGKSQITIDKIDLEVVDPNAVSTQTTSGQSTTSGLPPATTTIISSTSPVSAKSSSSPPVGAIAGGVLGGLATVILALLLLIWCRRRPKSSAPQSNPSPPLTSIVVEQPGHTSYLTEPYIMRERTFEGTSDSGIVNPTYSRASTDTSLGPRTSIRKPRLGHTSQFSTTTTFTTTETVSTSTGPASTVSGPSSTSTGRRRRREVDAGPVSVDIDEEDDEDDDARTLPPDYGDVFTNNRDGR